MSDGEPALVEGAKRGQARAFEALVLLHQGRIRAFFAARLRDGSMVDDLAQDTFLIAYQRLSTYDASTPFFAWLRGIALNVLRNELRKHKHVPPVGTEALQEALEHAAEEQAEQLQERVDFGDLLAALQRCLGRLKGSAEQIILERYQAGLSLEAIASRAGKTPKALSVDLFRLRQKLRDCMLSGIGLPRSGGAR